MLANVKTTTTYTLSALGDSFFSASLTGLWSLSAGVLVATGHYIWAALLAAGLFSSIQAFRALTFWYGYREGFRVLGRLRRWDLINWGRKIKIINALFLLLFWFMIAPPDTLPLRWPALLAGMGLLALGVGRLNLSRELVLGLALCAGLALAWLGKVFG